MLLYYKDRNVWEYDNDNFSTLCDYCHERWHKIYNEIKELLCIPGDFLQEYRDLLKELDTCLPPEILYFKLIIKIFII